MGSYFRHVHLCQSAFSHARLDYISDDLRTLPGSLGRRRSAGGSRMGTEMANDKYDDLDRRLAEAWKKSPSLNKGGIRARLRSILSRKPRRVAATEPVSIPSRQPRRIAVIEPAKGGGSPPQPIATSCPTCGSDDYYFDARIDWHVCVRCGRKFT